MPKYLATIKEQNGATKTMVVEALDRNGAILSIQRQGVFLISLGDVDSVKLAAKEQNKAKKSNFTHSNVTTADISSFAKQLATMLEAGVPLLRSITVIAEQVESRDLSRVLFEVRTDVESGQSFSKTLSKHPKVFSPFWVSLVEVGEASGTMPRVLKQLTEYMEQAERFQAQITGALIYPGILLTICTAAILVFALFVGPTFEKIFKDMDIKLPGITVMMLASFNIIKSYFLLIIGGIVSIIFLFKKYISTPVGRLSWEKFLFGVPGLGPIIKMIIVEKFASQMAILIESGVPILYALEISEKLVDNMVCGAIIKDIRDSVREGKLLADPMDKSGFFPPMTVQMIRVGEETGELGAMLNHVAVYYKGVVEEFMKHIGTLIEPVMLVFMGGIIGTIVVAMFLPLLSISSGG